MFVQLNLIGVCLVLFFIWMRYRLTYFERRGIPHRRPLPIVGNLWGWRVTKSTSEITQDLYIRFKDKGPFIGVYFMLCPGYIIADMELLKRILIKDFHNFDSRGLFYNEKNEPLSAHLFALDGPKWHSLRPKMTPIFSCSKMKMMFPSVLKVAKDLTDILNERCMGLPSQQEMTKLLACYTADTIGSAVFGLDCNSLSNPKAPFVQMGLNAMLKKRYVYIFCLLFPKLSRKLGLKRTPQDVENFYLTMVRDTLKFREEHKIKRNDLVDILLELKHKHDNGNTEEGLTINEIAAQMYVFLVAGFETTSTALSLALYELAKNEQIQSQLRAEIEQKVWEYNERGELTYQAMQDMKYLDQVISETLRKYPVATEHLRACNKDYVMPEHPKFYIPAGSHIVVPVYAIHHDPAYYPEPEEFRPERFTEKAIQQRPTCSYLPFGLGPRICIGMRFARMKLAVGLIELVRKFHFTTCQKTPKSMPFEKHTFLLHTKGGFELQVKPIRIVKMRQLMRLNCSLNETIE